MTTPMQMDHETLEWEYVVGNTRYGRYSSEVEKHMILKAHSLIARPTTAFEVGCEGGHWAKLLADSGWHMICTDVDARSLAICKKRLPEATCTLVSQDDLAFPCPTGSIGLVSCIQVAPVINAGWFIDEIFRVLQKDGLLVGVFWNRTSWRGAAYHSLPFLRKNRKGAWYWYPHSYARWKKRLCTTGFSIVDEVGYGWPPFRRTSNSPIVPVMARMEQFLGLHRCVDISPMVAFIAQKR